MSNTNIYESPLSSRYASDEMLYLFSPDKKFTTWRRLWVALARAEMELGLPVTKEQVEELEAHIDDINYEVAAKEEKKLRHDVMAHVHAYGAQCPKAMPICSQREPMYQEYEPGHFAACLLLEEQQGTQTPLLKKEGNAQ